MGTICRFNYWWMYIIVDSPQYDNGGNRKAREAGTCPPISGRWPAGRSSCPQYWNLKICRKRTHMCHFGRSVLRWHATWCPQCRWEGTDGGDRCFMKWVATSSIHEPPQRYAHIRERRISLHWYHTVCISIQMWNLWLVPKEHQIAPWRKKPPKGVRFSDFYLYFCHVIWSFFLLVFATLR